jgi:TatD DNase family protein
VDSGLRRNDGEGVAFSSPGVPDAHCHLAALPDAEAAVLEAIAAGVTPILAVAMEPAEFAAGFALRSRFPGHVLAGVGIHPSRVPMLDDAALAAELAEVEGAAAEADFVGEVGLDYKDAPEPFQQKRQREALDRQLAIAEDRMLPVNLHTRRADSDLLAVATAFTRRTGLPALLHWFTHSRRLAHHGTEAGLFISVGPSILIDPRQAQVAVEIDPDFLLVETDSPVAYGGESACPAWAVRVAAALAHVRGEDLDVMQARLTANLARFMHR